VTLANTPLPQPQTAEFVVERRVRFGDCDPAGIVFFPRYVEMLNSVVEDWWLHIGKPWTEMITQRRIGTPVVHVDTTFLIPSLMGDTLQFHLSVEKIGNASLALLHSAFGADGKERLRFRQQLVATSLDTHRSIPWPEDIRQAITQFTKSP